jgi:hypothetical protein
VGPVFTAHPDLRRDRGMDTAIAIGLMVAYVILQAWLLPRLGIST